MDSTLDPFGTPDAGNASAPNKAGLAGEWSAFLDNPDARAALLSTGLQLMQPVALGQSPIGHLAQALGSGAHSVAIADARYNAQDAAEAKATQETAKLGIAQERNTIANRRADIAQQNANTRAKGGTGGLTLNQMLGAQTRQAAAADKAIADEARAIVTQLGKDINVMVGQPPTNPALAPYAGKTPGQIQEMLRADPKVQERLRSTERAKIKIPGAAAPDDSADDDEEGDQGDANSNANANTSNAAPFEGQTATNPATGQKVVFRGGKWVYP